MSGSLVSVLIPAYNAGRTIERALASVFAQDYQPVEIIVIDDGSTDNTGHLAARHGNAGVRLVRLPHNCGVSAATNAGLGLATGEFIAFLDADDEWLPGKLEAQVAVLKSSPGASFVCGPWREAHLSGTVTVQPAHRPSGPSSQYAWRELLAGSYVLKSTVVARRMQISTTGGFDESLQIAEDQDMWIKLAIIGTVVWHPAPLTVHHQVPDSLTQRYVLRQQEFVLPMITMHLRAQRHHLTPKEIRAILGTRYAQIGRSLYQAGRYSSGLYYLGRAILLGTQPTEHLWYILIASPPVRWLRQRLCSPSRKETRNHPYGGAP